MLKRCVRAAWLAAVALLVWTAAQPVCWAGPALLNSIDAETWLDGLIPYAMARGDIAGGVVVVVKDGQILLEKGYGYADAEKQTAVDPQRTLFRLGSVSKLFTWTAVMQLVEAGKLDLDRDVNNYLDFAIPPFAGKGVTLRQLMTHTAGFEETVKRLAVAGAEDVMPLGAYLRDTMPPRVFEAGTTPAYSNYGTALAGYIVQLVAKQSFEDYVEQHILVPLEMRRSTFRQPVPAELADDLSKAYARAAEPPKPFEFVTPVPAGALAGSGDDMAHFMIAHLQNGHYGHSQILRPETAQLMHATANVATPPLNGMALGFWEAGINGHRVLAHGGDTLYFHSDLSLFVDDGVGLFVAFNSTGSDAAQGLRDVVFRSFGDRYFPAPPGDDRHVDDAMAREHAGLIAGMYDSSRRSMSNLLAIGNLFNQTKVVANDDGTISMGTKMPGGEPWRYREIGKFLWQQVGGHDRLTAVLKDGKVERFSVEPSSSFLVWLPTPLNRSSAWLLPAAGASFAILLLTAVQWPAGLMMRLDYGVSLRLTGARAWGYHLLRFGALLVTAALVALLGLFVVQATGDRFIALISGRQDSLIQGLQIFLGVALVTVLLAALFNAAAVLFTRSSWRARFWGFACLCAVGVQIWLALAFNMLTLIAQY